MASYPYTSNPARAKQFFEAIQGLGVPPKVTTKFLESLGYKSKNDRAILTILRGVGFIDASGTPTDAWRKFRNKSQAGAVMASALRAAYSDLFTTYPDAYRRDNEALRNFFSTHSTVGEGGLRFMVGTFKALAELGDFGADDVPLEARSFDDANGDAIGDVIAPTNLVSRRGNGNGAGAVVLNINIQLQIPETEKAEVYDSFFAAMKKHLLS